MSKHVFPNWKIQWTVTIEDFGADLVGAVYWGETRVRVRAYNQEKVTRHEIVYRPEQPGGFDGRRDGPKQRRVRPHETRTVTRFEGRPPPKVQYTQHVTASLGRFTGCGQTRTEALKELRRLVLPTQN